MKNYNAPENQTTRRILPIACGTAFVVAFTVAGPRRQGHSATRARQHSGARGEQGVPRGSRRRHPELHLLTLRRYLRLDTLYAAGHFVQRQ
jgi:hypothetical protein